MDKSTFSNYGWIVIVTIIIAILLGCSANFATAVKNNFIGVVNRLSSEADEAFEDANGGAGNSGGGGSGKQLSAPTIELNGDVLIIHDESGRAEEFVVFINGNVATTLQKDANTLDLTTLDLPKGVRGITVKAKAGGYADSPESNAVNYVVMELPYLTLSSPNDFTLATGDQKKNWSGTLEYSTDTNTWSVWDGSTISAVDGNLYLRGTGNASLHRTTGYASTNRWVLTGSDIACSGNIENLLDYATVANGEHPVMELGCFSYLFYNCTARSFGLDGSFPRRNQACCRKTLPLG